MYAGKGNYIGTATQMYSNEAGGFHYFVQAKIDGKDYIWDNYNNGVLLEDYKKQIFGHDYTTGKDISGEDLINNATKMQQK
ncbi:MAG: hypothetical protein Q8M29_16535 [Bacteroidota bacterium]|nr:hypothetical protein [Bacteroidota bacterium]